MSALQPLRFISSMATRALLAELAAAARASSPAFAVDVESVGGVDAARRVAAGEALDGVVLASDAVERLAAAGHVRPASRVDLVRSSVAAAVRAGAPLPDFSSEAAVRAAVLAAPSLAYSTGPSGTALVALFERWGVADAVRPKLVQAPPGVPVGTLVARGEVALGFQQLSELIALDGIALVGTLPAPIDVTTVFSGAVAATSARADEVRAVLAAWAAPEAAAAKRRHGMAPG